MFPLLPFLIASPTTGIISLWSAFSLGVLHGFEPGHGKGIVSAYVAGKKPNVLELLGLCGILTLSHSIGAFSLVLLGLAFGGSLNQLDPAFIQSVHILAGSFVVVLGIHLQKIAVRWNIPTPIHQKTKPVVYPPLPCLAPETERLSTKKFGY